MRSAPPVQRSVAAAALALAPFLVQCAGAADSGKSDMAMTGSLQSKIEWAMQDAAQRTQRDRAQLRVTLAESVTWPDGALGCPEPGRQYAQVLVSGYRIRIAAGGETLEYHGSLRGQPFLCPPSRIQPPTAADPRASRDRQE